MTRKIGSTGCTLLGIPIKRFWRGLNKQQVLHRLLPVNAFCIHLYKMNPQLMPGSESTSRTCSKTSPGKEAPTFPACLPLPWSTRPRHLTCQAGMFPDSITCCQCKTGSVRNSQYAKVSWLRKHLSIFAGVATQNQVIACRERLPRRDVLLRLTVPSTALFLSALKSGLSLISARGCAVA